MARERLHKFLASAGIASRRRCEELITEGRVTVDGLEVRELGTMVDPAAQEIRFDGEKVRREAPVHYVVNKPVGYICTNRDDQGRPTVVSLVRDRKNRRLFTVGRLDEDSEGLILVTNDGEFANLVAHPRYGVEKLYSLKLHGGITETAITSLRKGVWLSEGKTSPIRLRLVKRSKQHSYVVARVAEGKNRMLRRAFARVGFAVSKLKRVRIGPIGIQGLGRGAVRRVTPGEIRALLEEVERNRSGEAVPGGTAALADARATKITRRPGKPAPKAPRGAANRRGRRPQTGGRGRGGPRRGR